MRGNVRGNYATCTNRGVMSNTDAGQDAHARADPHVILDNDWFRWRQHAVLVEIVLVVVEDEGVVTQKTVAADSDPFVR